MIYQLTFTEAERTQLAAAFGLFVTKLANAAVIVDAASGTDQARAILAPPLSTPAQPTAPPAAAPPPAPIATRDRWARDRKGNEVPNPAECVALDVHIWKTQQTAKFLKVTWQSTSNGYVDANCFDQQLWPWLIKAAGSRTRLYVVRKGNYTNIVGVHA